MGRNFWLRLTTASAQCLRLSARFFILCQPASSAPIIQTEPSEDIEQSVRKLMFMK